MHAIDALAQQPLHAVERRDALRGTLSRSTAAASSARAAATPSSPATSGTAETSTRTSARASTRTPAGPPSRTAGTGSAEHGLSRNRIRIGACVSKSALPAWATGAELTEASAGLIRRLAHRHRADHLHGIVRGRRLPKLSSEIGRILLVVG